MPSQIYLPTEIVVQIVHFIATTTEDQERQGTLHACCLISRHWYSVAVSFLYGRPVFRDGIALKRFADTVCSPNHAQKSRLNLGSFVRYLDLNYRSHDGTNILMAKLLSRVSENLEVFIAPSGESLP